MQRSKEEIVAAYNRQVGADTQRVSITGTDMTFEDMVLHQLKWIAATCVAILVLVVPVLVLYLLFTHS